MTAAGRLIASASTGAFGLWLIYTGTLQRRPALAKMSEHLHRSPTAYEPEATVPWLTRMGRPLSRRLRFAPSALADLRLVQRPAEVHAVYVAGACIAGLFGPELVVLMTARQRLIPGFVSIGSTMPLLVSLLAAVVAPLAVHTVMRNRAAVVRGDLRHQLSAYLDVVTMLLAGNVGNEGALRQAAQAGDGRLFIELRRRILVAETSNRSIVTALAHLGDDLELVELQQIAASAALGASAGAPVARSLAAKCATLRSALASEQEADARVRTGKITVPLVAMSLLIMAAVMYPALNY